MSARQIRYPLHDRWTYLWLLLVVVLGVFSLSVGKWVIPLAAWLQTIFVIRFMRTQRHAWLAYLLLAAATALSVFVALPDYLGQLRIPIVVGSSIIASLVPLADRLLVPRLPSFIATLVFPLAFTSVEFVNSTTNPLGSYGALAYSQYDNLALLQLAAVTGMSGIAFLITWFAAVVNYAWEREFAWPEIRRGVLIYAGVVVAVVLLGQLRLWFAPPPATTVRVAGVIPVDFRAGQAELFQVDRPEGTPFDWEKFRQISAERQDLYFSGTMREARGGAQIVVWPEFAIPVLAEDEEALLARAAEVAQQENIYLAMSVGKLYRDDSPYEQKVMVVNPNGKVVLNHLKYGGVGFEGDRVNGDGILRTVATPFGVLSAVICWDTDFPATVLQAGRTGVDILLSPSLEFQEMGFIHAQMAAIRAVENGVAVVRVADNGTSVITDPYGRVLASMDFFSGGTRAITAQVPTQSVPTLYPFIGDLFGWLALAGFLLLVIWAIVRSRKASTAQPTSLAPVQ